MPEIDSVARKFSDNMDNFHIIRLSNARKFTTKDTRSIIYKSLIPYILTYWYLKMPVKKHLRTIKLNYGPNDNRCCLGPIPLPFAISEPCHTNSFIPPVTSQVVEREGKWVVDAVAVIVVVTREYIIIKRLAIRKKIQ